MSVMIGEQGTISVAENNTSVALSEDFLRRCASIRVVVADVDGTLTDGGMYYTSEGAAMKRFSAHDGMGIVLLMQSGIELVFLTSDSSGIAEARAKKLGVRYVFEGVENKALKLKDLAAQLQVKFPEIAYIGDDVNDASAIELVGISACPADAVQAIKRKAHYICQKRGGHGAFREFADLILAQKKA